MMMICLALCLALISARPVAADHQHQFAGENAGVSPQQPQVAVAPDGSIYVTYGSQSSIYCAFSRDQGKTFSPPVLVANEGALALALGMHRGPRIAATRDSVVISAIVGKQGKGRDGNLLAWRSGDRGQSTGDLEKSNDNHREVFLAVKAKDRRKARKAMLAVLKQTERDLLERERK
jgi:hypothetical protein